MPPPIRKFTRGYPRVIESANKIIEPFNRGFIQPSEEFDVERQPDGRLRVTLSQTVRAAMSGGTPPPPVEGEFTGDVTMPLEDLFNVTVDNAFAFTLVWAMFVPIVPTASEPFSIAVLWGPQGEGASFVAFSNGEPDGVGGIWATSEEIGPFYCNQAVPALGFIQLNTTNQVPDAADPISFRYTLHYTIP